MNVPTARKAGRPRKIKARALTGEELNVEPEVPTIDVTKSEPLPEDLAKSKGVRGIGRGILPVIPFRGKENLKIGEMHYFVNGNPSTGYKLIRCYLDKFGKCKRALEKTLKPNKRTPRGANDRSILTQLKALGVSGIL